MALTEQAYRERAREVILRRDELIQRFLPIAERRVSTLDEYGDENWKGLDREIFRCIEKIGQAEGEAVTLAGAGTDKYREQASFGRAYEGRRVYRELFSIIEQQFRSYHAKRPNSTATAEEIGRMGGADFENYLMRRLKALGCAVSGTPRSGDKGADIIAKIAGRTIVIQAKRSIAPVGNRAVQEVFSALAYYGGTEAWVVTNATFTQAAQEIAGRHRVRLVSGADLARMGEILEGPTAC